MNTDPRLRPEASIVMALAAPVANARLERSTVLRRALGPRDVRIDIVYTGICHSDVHQVADGWGDVWGRSSFPLVPGHEIAGVVGAVGAEVSRFAVGDRVGVGCIVASCLQCENCLADQEQYCLRGMVWTYNDVDYDGAPTHGGYSTMIVVDEHYVLRIPDAIPLDVAAPLLCAGITVYSPLKHWKVGPGKRVAVVGLGGLGHMAVKIAHALEAHVTVLSRSENKREDSARLGADSFYSTSDPVTFAELANSFDFILNTVAANLDFDAYLSLLRLDGAMVNVGLPEEPVGFSMFSLVGGRKGGRRSLAGSNIGGIRETQELLDFCGRNGLGADIELVGVDEVNNAYERMLRSDVQYRFVIDIATFRASA